MNNVNRSVLLVCFRLTGFLVISLLCAPSMAVEKLNLVIGITKDQSDIDTHVPVELIKSEILDLLGGDHEVTFKNAWDDSSWKENDFLNNSHISLKDPEVDLILALGILSGQILGFTPNLPKPVIAPFVIDPKLQGFNVVNGTSGIRNFTYIADTAEPGEIVSAFNAIVPFERLVVVLSPAILQGIPQIASIMAQQSNMKFIEAKENPAELLRELEQGDYDAVMFTPLLGYSPVQLSAIANGLTERAISSFTMQDEAEVNLGFLAGYGSEVDNLVARRIALNVQRILDGQPAENIPVYLNSHSRVLINEQVARKLNRYPGWDLVDKFDVVNEDKSHTKQLSLREALKIVQERSLHIAANVLEIQSSSYQLKQSRSNLLPQAHFQAEHERFDADLASANNPEKQNSSGVFVSQVLWSEEAFRGYSAQKYFHLAITEVGKQVTLDAVLDVLTIYLNLLQAQHIEELQLANLKRAKRNLELAEVRKRVGTGAAGEVYRWQSEIANSQSNWLSAKSKAKQLSVNLLQVLNLPQNENLELSPLTVAQAGFFFNDERFRRYLPNSWSFEKYNNFMISEAIQNSPELSQLQAEIKAQEELLKSSKRKRWTPTVTATGGYNNIFETDGIGANDAFEQEGWQAELSIQLPIFTGGKNAANQKVQSSTLDALRVKEKIVLGNIEAQVRINLLASQASFPSMGYSAEAASYSNKNLELVTDAYQRGALSILDLVDAQNSALSADIQAVNSVYDFMRDYFKLQRVVGYFDILSSSSEKEDWYRRLKESIDYEK